MADQETYSSTSELMVTPEAEVQLKSKIEREFDRIFLENLILLPGTTFTGAVGGALDLADEMPIPLIELED